MDKSYVHMILALLAGVSFLFIVPKEQYKKMLLYAIIFGALVSVIVASLSTLFGLIQHKAMGPFDIFGIFPYWAPITWTYAIAIFFYLLPVKRIFIAPYLVGFAGLSYMTGLTLQNFGLFEYVGMFKYTAPLVFFSWLSIAAWVYYRVENISLVSLEQNDQQTFPRSSMRLAMKPLPKSENADDEKNP